MNTFIGIEVYYAHSEALTKMYIVAEDVDGDAALPLLLRSPLVTQTAMAFRVIQNALSIVVTKIRTLASMASEVDRLHFLLMCMETMVRIISL